MVLLIIESINNYNKIYEVNKMKAPEKLNENFYIVPGLGDMGDRLFGTV